MGTPVLQEHAESCDSISVCAVLLLIPPEHFPHVFKDLFCGGVRVIRIIPAVITQMPCKFICLPVRKSAVQPFKLFYPFQVRPPSSPQYHRP